MAELLSSPYNGLPDVIDTPEKFRIALDQLAAGNGPYAVDAERASGYKYSSRAYLIQIKRTDGGLHLIDPIPFGPMHPLFIELNQQWADHEVILHASTQDLPCMRELGLSPLHLFDTELAGRILGLPRVGLGALVESLLDISLAKEHSSQDWSIRPLPTDWLNYAALDVELLVDLRDEIEALLESSGKIEWSRQEFAAILAAPAPTKRVDPWRRTSGGHKIKKGSQLTVMRDLWLSRDELAQSLDISPGRLLTDAAISTLALASDSAPLTTRKQLEKVLRPIGLRARWFEHSDRWIATIASALATPEALWPAMRVKSDALPPIKLWREKFAERYTPYSHARFNLTALAAKLELPVENLLTPEIGRRICWNLGGQSASLGRIELGDIELALKELGARPWQIEATAAIFEAALRESEPLELPEPGELGEESSESS
ncbi:MAG: hypothetical protein RJA33_615 [Actinomycetota bacterium]